MLMKTTIISLFIWLKKYGKSNEHLGQIKTLNEMQNRRHRTINISYKWDLNYCILYNIKM